jgi:hypothetical protein
VSGVYRTSQRPLPRRPLDLGRLLSRACAALLLVDAFEFGAASWCLAPFGLFVAAGVVGGLALRAADERGSHGY